MSGSTEQHSHSTWPDLVPRFRLEPARTALVLVDLQCFSTTREVGWGPVLGERFPDIADYYFPRIEETLLPNCANLLAAFRAAHCPVVFLRVGSNRDDGADFLRLRGDATHRAKVSAIPKLGSPEHGINEAVRPLDGEIVLDKVTRSGFTSTGLNSILRNLQIRDVVIGGVLTNSCVESTARDASDRGFRTALVDDASATFDAASHSASLDSFSRIFGRVVTSREVSQELQDGPR